MFTKLIKNEFNNADLESEFEDGWLYTTITLEIEENKNIEKACSEIVEKMKELKKKSSTLPR